MIRWFAARYLRDDEDATVPLRSPLLAPALANSPPTYLLAAAYDPLVDEGRAYAERLRAEGVAVTYDLRATLPHGIVNIAGVRPGRTARAARRDSRDRRRAARSGAERLAVVAGDAFVARR